MRISDWSSDVALPIFAELLALLEISHGHIHRAARHAHALSRGADPARHQHPVEHFASAIDLADHRIAIELDTVEARMRGHRGIDQPHAVMVDRSEEHTSELQSLMRISYAVFCLKKKNYRKI